MSAFQNTSTCAHHLANGGHAAANTAAAFCSTKPARAGTIAAGQPAMTLKDLKEAEANLIKYRELLRKTRDGKLLSNDGGAKLLAKVKELEQEVAVWKELKAADDELRRKDQLERDALTNAARGSRKQDHSGNGGAKHCASDDDDRAVVDNRVRSICMAPTRPAMAPPTLATTKRSTGAAMMAAALAKAVNENMPTPKAQTASTSNAMHPRSDTPRTRNDNYGNVQDFRPAPSRTPASAPPAMQTQSVRVPLVIRRPRTVTEPKKKKGLRCCKCKDAIDLWTVKDSKLDTSKLMCDDCREANTRQRDDSGAEQPQSAPVVYHRRRLRKHQQKEEVVKNLQTEALDLVSDDEDCKPGSAAPTQDAPAHTDVDTNTDINTNTNPNNQHSMALRSTLRRSLQNRVVLYPGREDPYAVEVRGEDLDRLGPCEFLNDTIIDMYIKYIQQHLEPEQQRRFHFFNSFFFKKLSERTLQNDTKSGATLTPRKRQHSRVKNWTKSVDIFAKDYLLHWSLAIICHPGLCDSDDPKEQTASCILHLDSMKSGHDGNILSRYLRGYLENEWAHRLNDENSVAANSSKKNRQFVQKTLPFVKAQVPQQDNEYDCGLFLLHYMELFASNAPKRFNLDTSMVNRTWFKTQEIVDKRSTLYKLLASLFGFELANKEEETRPHAEEASVPADVAVDGNVADTLPEQIKRIFDERDSKADAVAGDTDDVAATTIPNGCDQVVEDEDAGASLRSEEKGCEGRGRRKRRRVRVVELSDGAQMGFMGIDAQLTQNTQAQAVQS
eukprot:jgi/Chlat1/8088/Chrsp75S07589